MSRDLIALQKKLPSSWKDLLDPLEPILRTVQENIDQELLKIPGLGIFPRADDTFRALHNVTPNQIKVVILGQDCYHQEGQAIGRAFAVPKDVKNPPSLVNIIREVRTDVNQLISDSTLENLSQQGVLLLNSALTVHQAKPGSHLKYWKQYTDSLIQVIAENTQNVVWMLWGSFAKGKGTLIIPHTKANNHLILRANHPSPLSANRGGWFGCKHFSQANQFLKTNQLDPIIWGVDI
jgi:uracil-DNA glycosylase